MILTSGMVDQDSTARVELPQPPIALLRVTLGFTEATSNAAEGTAASIIPVACHSLQLIHRRG